MSSELYHVFASTKMMSTPLLLYLRGLLSVGITQGNTHVYMQTYKHINKIDGFFYRLFSGREWLNILTASLLTT